MFWESVYPLFWMIIIFKNFYLFERESASEWEGAQAGGGAEGEGETDHDLSQRQMLNQLSHTCAPWMII